MLHVPRPFYNSYCTANKLYLIPCHLYFSDSTIQLEEETVFLSKRLHRILHHSNLVWARHSVYSDWHFIVWHVYDGDDQHNGQIR
jgi:hypothetical protein